MQYYIPSEMAELVHVLLFCIVYDGKIDAEDMQVKQCKPNNACSRNSSYSIIINTNTSEKQESKQNITKRYQIRTVNS